MAQNDMKTITSKSEHNFKKLKTLIFYFKLIKSANKFDISSDFFLFIYL